MLKIAMLQMRVIPGERERNLTHAAEMIAAAGKGGAKLAILPECCDFGWSNETARDEAETLEGETLARLCSAARNAGIYVAAGIVVRDDGKLYNTAVLISDAGILLGVHRKINLVPDVEDGIYTPGAALSVLDTTIGRIAIPICADNFESTAFLGQSLGFMGTEMLISPCSWAVSPENYGKPYGDEWIRPYTQLAERFHMPVIGVSNVGDVVGGAWNGWFCIGNSIAVNRNGGVEAVLPYGKDAETIRFIEV